MEQTKTHWKKLTNPEYLGAYAFMPGEEKIGTIDHVTPGVEVTGPDGKKEQCTVAYFKERDLKPLILNVTNCKAISRLYGSDYIEDWAGKRIVMGVQKVPAFGERVDAVRIRPKRPPEAPTAAPTCEVCKRAITPANNLTGQQVAEYTMRKYGKRLCAECAAKEAKSK